MHACSITKKPDTSNVLSRMAYKLKLRYEDAYKYHNFKESVYGRMIFVYEHQMMLQMYFHSRCISLSAVMLRSNR